MVPNTSRQGPKPVDIADGTMNDTKTLLLTGGTGFLGSNLLRRLVEENFRIYLLIRQSSSLWRINDLIDRVFLVEAEKTCFEEFFQRQQINVIVHCATNFGRREIEPTEMLEANLLLPLKLLQAGSNSGVSCFINNDTILDKRVNYYALSKSQLKEWLHVYADRMACINVALEHFYGPLDDQTKFVTYIIRSLLQGVASIDLTKGEQRRDFIFIDDVTDAFVRIIKQSLGLRKGYFSYEIGTSNTIEIREFVTLVKKLVANTSTTLNFGAIPYRENEVMDSTVDCSAIERLCWNPNFSLQDGLWKTIAVEGENAKR